MIVTRVGPLSFAKISGVVYALVGLIAGACFSLVSLVGGLAGAKAGMAPFGMFFGVAAIVVFPIMYGVGGFVFSLIGAALYNLVASKVGGVELQMNESPKSQ